MPRKTVPNFIYRQATPDSCCLYPFWVQITFFCLRKQFATFEKDSGTVTCQETGEKMANS